MALLYIIAVWIHCITVCLWIGAMFFGDPHSERFFSRLFERKLNGIGWYAQTVLWNHTGLYMLYFWVFLWGSSSPLNSSRQTQRLMIWMKMALGAYVSVLCFRSS